MTFQITHRLLLWTLLVHSGCNAPQSAPTVEQQGAPQVAETPAQQASEAARESMPKGLFDQDPRGLEAWLRFTADGRCRMAVGDEFQNPEAVRRAERIEPWLT